MTYGISWERPRRVFPWREAGCGGAAGVALLVVQMLLLRYVLGAVVPVTAPGLDVGRAWLVLTITMCFVAGLAAGRTGRVLCERRDDGAGRGVVVATCAGSMAGVVTAVVVMNVARSGPVPVLTAGGVAFGAVLAGAAAGGAAGTRTWDAVVAAGAAAVWLGPLAQEAVSAVVMPAMPLDADGEFTMAALHGLAQLRVWSPVAYGAGTAVAVAGAAVLIRGRRPEYVAGAAPLVLHAAAVLVAIPLGGAGMVVVGSAPQWLGLVAGCVCGTAAAMVAVRIRAVRSLG